MARRLLQIREAVKDFFIFSCLLGAGIWYVESRPAPPPLSNKSEMIVANAPNGIIAGRWDNVTPTPSSTR